MRLLSKISVWIFTVLYFFMSTGIGYSAHYCGEELFKFGHIATDVSCCCEEGSIDDCCHNESYFVQLDDVQQAASNDIRLISENEIQLLPSWQLNGELDKWERELTFQPKQVYSLHLKYPPLYLIHTSFIFYG